MSESSKAELFNGTLCVPLPLARMLGLLPAYPGSFLFVASLNLALAPRLPQETLQQLAGKHIRIDVRDAQLQFDFTCRKERFFALAQTGQPDLSIGASAYDFLLLMRREEDPDTLFFARRLLMEGDTELGLLVKNSLDALEFSMPGLLRRNS